MVPFIGFAALIIALDGASNSKVARDVHSCVTIRLSKVAQVLYLQHFLSGLSSIKKYYKQSY